ncbi:MAG: DUF4381 domain-containing protein [Thiohalomonadales bacterium]
MNDLPDIPIRDIHLPDPVSWWFPALGWWVVFGVILILIFGVVMLLISRKNKRYQCKAKLDFQKLLSSYEQILDTHRYVRELSVYLRKTAIHFYSRGSVAGLTGNRWLQFLDETSPHKQDRPTKKPSSKIKFQSEVGQLLLTAPYDSNANISTSQVQQLTILTESWLAQLPIGRLKHAGQMGS